MDRLRERAVLDVFYADLDSPISLKLFLKIAFAYFLSTPSAHITLTTNRRQSV